MKITLLGASGYVGKELLKKTIGQGYQVKVLARNPEKIKDFSDKIEIIKGDYFNKESIIKAVAGSDIVVSTIGPSTKKPYDVGEYKKSMINAMTNLIAIMKAEKVKRFIIISGCATPISQNESFNFRQNFIKVMLNLTAKYIIEIKTEECALLKQSTIDWIVMRPPAITRGTSTGFVKADETILHRLRIDVSDLTDFILKQLESDEWVHKAPLVCSIRQ